MFTLDGTFVCFNSIFSQGHTDCTVRERDKNWRFSGFYDNRDASFRFHSWELLRRLAGIRELKGLPWLVGGDFNEIYFDSKKLGGNHQPSTQMQGLGMLWTTVLYKTCIVEASCLRGPTK